MADRIGIICPTATSNTPSISSAATAIAANPVRAAFMIQNLGTNALFINFGGTASTSVFHVVLKGGSVADDGTGGSFAMSSGVIFTGDITIAGTSPRYTTTELSA